jgi:hypothetical protein
VSRADNDEGDEPILMEGNPSTGGLADVRQVNLGDPALGFGEYLPSVSCMTSSTCGVVGANVDEFALIGFASPAAWSVTHIDQIPLSASFERSNALNSPWCASATKCVAVGLNGWGAALWSYGSPSQLRTGHFVLLPASLGTPNQYGVLPAGSRGLVRLSGTT